MKVLPTVSVADFFSILFYCALRPLARTRAMPSVTLYFFDAIGNLPSYDGYMYKYALIIDKYAISLRRFFSKLYL